MNDRRKVKKPRALPSAARISKTTAVLVSGFMASGALEAQAGEVDPRQVYNKGTEAYHSGDFAAANDSLRASLRTQDLKLQQRAYYNLGNTLYRTGQGNLEKDPEATIKSWEEAVKAYDDALALDAGDEDAAFNKELVTRKLEELKNQQKQEDQKNDEKKDQEKPEEGEDSEEEQKPEDGDKGDEEKESEDKPGEEPQEEDSKEGEDSKPGEDPAEDGEESNEKEPEQGESEDPADAESGEEKSEEEKQAEVGEERGEKEQMTEEEALQLIESLRDDERMVIPIPRADRREDNTTKGKTW
jgi:Ca-activated chloride channel homolog